MVAAEPIGKPYGRPLDRPKAEDSRDRTGFALPLSLRPLETTGAGDAPQYGALLTLLLPNAADRRTTGPGAVVLDRQRRRSLNSRVALVGHPPPALGG